MITGEKLLFQTMRDSYINAKNKNNNSGNTIADYATIAVNSRKLFGQQKVDESKKPSGKLSNKALSKLTEKSSAPTEALPSLQGTRKSNKSFKGQD